MRDVSATGSSGVPIYDTQHNNMCIQAGFTLANSLTFLISIARPSSNSVVSESEFERTGLTDLIKIIHKNI